MSEVRSTGRDARHAPGGFRLAARSIAFVVVQLGVLVLVARSVAVPRVALATGDPGPLLRSVLASVLTAAVALAITWLFLRRVDRQPWSNTGLTRQGRPVTDAALGAACAVVLVGGALVIARLQGSLVAGPPRWDVLGWQRTIPVIVAAVLSYVSVGLREEVIFRGYLLPEIAQRLAFWVATVVSAAVFTVVHLLNGGLSAVQIVVIFSLGVLLAVGRRATGALWFPVAFHAAYDGTSMFAGTVLGYSFPGAGETRWASTVLLPLVLAFTVAYVLLNRRHAASAATSVRTRTTIA